MPNWCSNAVEISHARPAEITRIRDALEAGRFCDAVIPVPEDLKITAGYLGDEAAQKELERKTAENQEKYGAGNWYDFCVSRWGTKWDVDAEGTTDVTNKGKTVSASFESAWAPPVGVYAELVRQGFSVKAYYYEPGMCFCGVFEDGDDDYYELGGMTSDQAAQEIPSELDDMFGIVETMQEYEMENSEELTEWIKDGVEKTKGGTA